MNYFFNAFLAFAFLLMSIVLFGQQSELPEAYIFKSEIQDQINGTDYNYKELSNRFQAAPKVYTFSEKAKRQSKVSTVCGVIAVAFIGSGLLAIRNCNDFECLGSAIVIILGVPFGTAGIITRIASIINKKNSIQRVKDYQERRRNNSSLHIGATQHGVGIVFTF